MRAHLPAALAAASLAALGGCSLGPKGFVCPARGGPPWRELTSQSFRVATDLDSAEARKVVEQLERKRAAVARAISLPADQAPARLEVVAFATRDEFTEWSMAVNQVGLFYRDAFGSQRALFGGGLGPELRRILTHELAHYLSNHAMVRQPRWFAEGFATYLETASQSDDRPEVGLPAEDAVQVLDQVGPIPARAVLLWKGSEVVAKHAYATSWLLVHYLVDAWPREFEAYRARLARAEEPAAAWNAVFPAWSLEVPRATENLDQALRAYWKSRGWRSREVAVSVEPRIEERPLGPGQVHAIRIEMARLLRTNLLAAEAEEALAEDPGHVEALRERARRQPGQALALARHAVATHPEDPRAWGLLGDSLRGEEAAAEREAAHRQAVALAPQGAEQHAALAEDLAARGRLAESLPLAERAVALAPWSPAALLVLAGDLQALGRCPEALLAASRSLDILGDDTPPAERQEVGSQVHWLEARCAPPGRAGPEAGRPAAATAAGGGPARP